MTICIRITRIVMSMELVTDYIMYVTTMILGL
jgi:hypothetical protein